MAVAQPPAEQWLVSPRLAAAFTASEGCCLTVLRAFYDGAWRPLLAEAPHWPAQLARPAFFGSPWLAPYSYGIADDTLDWQNRRVPLMGGRGGRCQHGIVRDQPWRVRAMEGVAATPRLTAGFFSAGSDDLLAQYPFPFELDLTAVVDGSRLTMDFAARNVGQVAMPFGLGIHPYFGLPLGGLAPAARCRVWSDAALLADTSAGRLQTSTPPPALDLTIRPDAATVLAANPRRAAGGALLLTYVPAPQALAADVGLSWSIIDDETGLGVVIETSADFRGLVMFAPPGDAIVSPVLSTNLPNAFELANHGADGGLITLQPGATWRGWARYTVVGQQPGEQAWYGARPATSAARSAT